MGTLLTLLTLLTLFIQYYINKNIMGCVYNNYYLFHKINSYNKH